MIKGKHVGLTGLFLLCTLWLSAQDSLKYEDTTEQLLFSGVVLNKQQKVFVPYTQILVTNKGIGCLSNNEGYFSFYAHSGDSIKFSALGFQEAFFVIPDTITSGKCGIVQLLSQDTIVLAETIIYPWPINSAEFVNSFLNDEIDKDKVEIAKKNLSISAIKQPRRVIFEEGDAAYNYDDAMQKKAESNYISGQVQSIPILSPIAWWKFIRAWRRGDFKNKKKK